MKIGTSLVMYETFYGLKARPFTIQPDPDFLFLGRKHSVAYAMLEYGIQNQVAFSVVCGEIGCGKTTLVTHLLNHLSDDLIVGVVSNTHPQVADLQTWIMLAFGLPYQGMSSVEMCDHFKRFLYDSYEEGQRIVLVVDEAQNLNAQALEYLRMLSNLNSGKEVVLQIILVGQPQLIETLRHDSLKQLQQRVAVDFFLGPLAADEIEDYIRCRLQAAGREDMLFTSQACQRIEQETGGIPRRINILCDMLLVCGFAVEAEQIDIDLVDEVIQDRAKFGCVNAYSET